MESGALEVCVVVDAGRFSATRIESISDGWGIAMSRAAQSGVLQMPVTATIVASHDIVAGRDPFADMPYDERHSAGFIMRQGKRLSDDRSAKRLAPDDARMFAHKLAEACGMSSRGAPPRRRRLVAVYRQAFNYSGGSEETAIIEACAKVHMGHMTMLLIGRQVSGAGSASVQLHLLAADTLQSAQSVADHVWSLLERHVGLRRDVPHSAPAWSVSRASGDVALMCDSCGSAPLRGHEGHHCAVCHMGVLHAVAVPRAAPAEPAPSRSPPARRAPPDVLRPPARPVPIPPPPTAPHPPVHLPRGSATAHPLGCLFRLVLRTLVTSTVLVMIWAFAKCAGNMLSR